MKRKQRHTSTGPHTRWHLTDHTTPSGGAIWRCNICGRQAETPSVDCNRPGKHSLSCAQEWRALQLAKEGQG